MQWSRLQTNFWSLVKYKTGKLELYIAFGVSSWRMVILTSLVLLRCATSGVTVCFLHWRRSLDRRPAWCYYIALIIIRQCLYRRFWYDWFCSMNYVDSWQFHSFKICRTASKPLDTWLQKNKNHNTSIPSNKYRLNPGWLVFHSGTGILNLV